MWLDVRESHVRRALNHEWSRPKLIASATRLSRGAWCVGAFVDLEGVFCLLLLRGEFSETPTSRPFITVPLAPVIAGLRQQLLAASESDEQPSLRFPPVRVSVATASRGGRS